MKPNFILMSFASQRSRFHAWEITLNKNELIEVLKKAVAGDATTFARAMEDDVIAAVNPKFDSSSGRLIVDVSLKAANGLPIYNFGNGLIYIVDGGNRGGSSSRSVRSWGVVQDTEIVTGIDIAVAEKGNHSAVWSVGTFLQTDEGYKLWTKSEKFEFKV